MPAGSTAGRGSEILLSGMVAEKRAAEKRNIGAKTWQRNEPSPEVEEGWGSSFPEGMTIGKARGNSDESLPGSSRDASVPGINEKRPEGDMLREDVGPHRSSAGLWLLPRVLCGATGAFEQCDGPDLVVFPAATYFSLKLSVILSTTMYWSLPGSVSISFYWITTHPLLLIKISTVFLPLSLGYTYHSDTIFIFMCPVTSHVNSLHSWHLPNICWFYLTFKLSVVNLIM